MIVMAPPTIGPCLDSQTRTSWESRMMKLVLILILILIVILILFKSYVICGTGFCRVQADMIIYIYPCIHLQLHMSCIHVHYIYVLHIILLFKIYDLVLMRSYGHIIIYVRKILFTQNQILRGRINFRCTIQNLV